ncbi:MAG TPA: ATP-binding cassette domain-containing protein [Polyangiaceae bacterium]|nr:ATP-binding cassette domain-containing protein [Polyangiaceae bacterium]
MIVAQDLSKTFRTASRKPGAAAFLRYLFHREYKEIQAVKNLSFSIPKGSICGFLGANGAGKTTTLKMLSGLIQPSSGTVRTGGFDPFERRKDFLRRITLVIGQKQQLIWDLPALDSLRVNAAVYEIDAAEAQRRIAELSELLGVSQKLDQPMRKLSLGERMKCELLAALLHRPEILFLDEPTLGLDINAQQSIRSFLREYNARYGATILLTSHYMADITALCERVLVMHEGSLVYDGSLQAIVDRATPVREVEFELSQPTTTDVLQRFGEVAEHSELKVRLLVPRSELTHTLAHIFEQLQPTDLSVKEPPIEAVMGQLLRDGKVEPIGTPIQPAADKHEAVRV